MDATLFMLSLWCLLDPSWTFVLSMPTVCLIPCGVHGTCNTYMIYQHCDCNPGYTGPYCDTATCASETCHGHGVCSDTFFGAKCDCDSEHFGQHCEYHNLLFPWFSSVTKSTTVQSVSTTTIPKAPTHGTHTMVTPTHKHGTTTTQSTKAVICSGSDIGNAITKNIVFTNNSTCTCSSGSCASPEAFVLDVCNGLASSSSWKPGLNVLQSCKMLSTSPVAIFKNGVHAADDIIGVFVKCLDDGFLIATQTCDRPPILQKISTSQDGSSNGLDINNFYTIDS